MKNKTDLDGNIVWCPTVEAVCDNFGILTDVWDYFEVSSRPRMNVALSLLYKSMNQLDSAASGADVWWGKKIGMVQPSVYSKQLCRNLVQYSPEILILILYRR